jgi:hypothetical protein
MTNIKYQAAVVAVEFESTVNMQKSGLLGELGR